MLVFFCAMDEPKPVDILAAILVSISTTASVSQSTQEDPRRRANLRLPTERESDPLPSRGAFAADLV